MSVSGIYEHRELAEPEFVSCVVSAPGNKVECRVFRNLPAESLPQYRLGFRAQFKSGKHWRARSWYTVSEVMILSSLLSKATDWIVRQQQLDLEFRKEWLKSVESSELELELVLKERSKAR